MNLRHCAFGPFDCDRAFVCAHVTANVTCPLLPPKPNLVPDVFPVWPSQAIAVSCRLHCSPPFGDLLKEIRVGRYPPGRGGGGDKSPKRGQSVFPPTNCAVIILLSWASVLGVFSLFWDIPSPYHQNGTNHCHLMFYSPQIAQRGGGGMFFCTKLRSHLRSGWVTFGRQCPSPLRKDFPVW